MSKGVLRKSKRSRRSWAKDVSPPKKHRSTFREAASEGPATAISVDAANITSKLGMFERGGHRAMDARAREPRVAIGGGVSLVGLEKMRFRKCR